MGYGLPVPAVSEATMQCLAAGLGSCILSRPQDPTDARITSVWPLGAAMVQTS